MCDLYILPIFRKMDDEDEIVVACTAVVVYSLGAAMIASKSKKRKHWLNSISRDRHRYDDNDVYSTMLPEMKANDMSWYVQ